MSANKFQNFRSEGSTCFDSIKSICSDGIGIIQCASLPLNTNMGFKEAL